MNETMNEKKANEESTIPTIAFLFRNTMPFTNLNGSSAVLVVAQESGWGLVS